MKNQHFEFIVNKEDNTILVEREFKGDLDRIWEAWTNPVILDQWWAPEPYVAVTKSMDFTAGGRWLYFMKGPEGDVHWSFFDYDEINPKTDFSGKDGFCNEQGVINSKMPQTAWEYTFTPSNECTRVDIRILPNSLESLEMLIEMGFKEGFTAGMENLDRYLLNL